MSRKRIRPEMTISALPVLLTSREVARALKVSPATLCRWRAAGVGPRVYWIAEASPRYLEADVIEWLKSVAA
ncbi:MAG: helix-turn-helix transcriptional regulator [Nocardioides sp.]